MSSFARSALLWLAAGPSRLEINSLRSALTAAAASQKITRYPGKGKHQI